MSDRPSALPRYPGIDGLRGLSILLVVIHHVAIRIRPTKTALGDVFPSRLLNALAFNGYEAVFVFFVISGFLITTHALARYGPLRDLDLRDFYGRRFARIVPPLVAIVAALSVADALGVPEFTIDPSRQSLCGAVGSAFGLHLNWYEGQTGYLPGGWDVLWSLSIEEVFYLGFPVACVALRRDLGIGLLFAALALSLPWVRPDASNEIWREKAYLPGMAGIGTGVVVALLADRFPARPTRVDAALRWGGGVALGSVFGWEDAWWGVLGEGTLLVLTLGAGAMVLGFHGASGPGLRAFGWLRSFGRLSYEIYLTHMFVVFAGVGLWRWLGPGLRWAFVWYLPIVPATWLLGWAFARHVSQPAERWLRARLRARPAPAANA